MTETEPQQITIPFVVNAEMTRANLFTSASNADVVQLIEDWPHWTGPIAIIHGPSGSGKSHNAHAWAEKANAEIWTLETLAAWSPDQSIAPNIAPNIAIENLGAMSEKHEVMLFHLINALKSVDGSLWLTAALPLQQWHIALPDLKSRLQTAVQVSLKAPDDILLSAVITKLFSDRQIEISPQNVSYLVTHMDRSLAHARQIVEAVDQEALRRKSKITRNIVADVLAKAQQNEPSF